MTVIFKVKWVTAGPRSCEEVSAWALSRFLKAETTLSSVVVEPSLCLSGTLTTCKGPDVGPQSYRTNRKRGTKNNFFLVPFFDWRCSWTMLKALVSITSTTEIKHNPQGVLVVDRKR